MVPQTLRNKAQNAGVLPVKLNFGSLVFHSIVLVPAHQHARTHIEVWGEPCLPFHRHYLFIYFFRQGLSVTWNSARRLPWLDRDPPLSVYPWRGYKYMAPCLSFFLHRFWSLNLDPGAVTYWLSYLPAHLLSIKPGLHSMASQPTNAVHQDASVQGREKGLQCFSHEDCRATQSAPRKGTFIWAV